MDKDDEGGGKKKSHEPILVRVNTIIRIKSSPKHA